MDLLKKLANVAIFSVDSIQTTYSLGKFNTSNDRENVAIEHDAVSLHILVSKRLPKDEWLQEICTSLSNLLRVDAAQMLWVVGQPQRFVESYLIKEGIPEINPDLRVDNAWLREAGTTTESSGEIENGASGHRRSTIQIPVSSLTNDVLVKNSQLREASPVMQCSAEVQPVVSGYGYGDPMFQGLALSPTSPESFDDNN